MTELGCLLCYYNGSLCPIDHIIMQTTTIRWPTCTPSLVNIRAVHGLADNELGSYYYQLTEQAVGPLKLFYISVETVVAFFVSRIHLGNTI